MTDKLHIADQMLLKSVEESAKLDQFLLGATVAICAYLAQTNTYAPVGINRSTALMFCLLIFALSAALGFVRLNTTVKIYQANGNLLAATNEEEEKASKQKCQDLLGLSIKLACWRSTLMFVGLGCYIATKVVASYYCQGCMPRLP